MKETVKNKPGRPKLPEKLRKRTISIKLRQSLIDAIDAESPAKKNRTRKIEKILAEKYYK